MQNTTVLSRQTTRHLALSALGKHMNTSILAKLTQSREAYQQQPLLMSEAELVAEHDAARRAHASALANNNVEGALLWAARANNIARQIAQIRERSESVEDLSA